MKFRQVLGNFRKFLEFFLLKKETNIWQLFGLFEKYAFEAKTDLATFGLLLILTSGHTVSRERQGDDA